MTRKLTALEPAAFTNCPVGRTIRPGIRYRTQDVGSFVLALHVYADPAGPVCRLPDYRTQTEGYWIAPLQHAVDYDAYEAGVPGAQSLDEAFHLLGTIRAVEALCESILATADDEIAFVRVYLVREHEELELVPVRDIAWQQGTPTARDVTLIERRKAA